MTDTTDIKALRELLCHEDLESDYHVGVTVTTLRLLLSKADQLEAERQRADDLQRINGIQETTIEVFRHKELAAMKGDQVPVAAGTAEKCSPDVYAKGVSACLIDIPKEKAEVICRGISEASGVAVDWHYVGGRVHIKAMRVTAPQKPVVKLAGDMPRAPFNYGMFAKGWNDRGLADKLAIEAAGGIVKDGE